MTSIMTRIMITPLTGTVVSGVADLDLLAATRTCRSRFFSTCRAKAIVNLMFILIPTIIHVKSSPSLAFCHLVCMINMLHHHQWWSTIASSTTHLQDALPLAPAAAAPAAGLHRLLITRLLLLTLTLRPASAVLPCTILHTAPALLHQHHGAHYTRHHFSPCCT